MNPETPTTVESATGIREGEPFYIHTPAAPPDDPEELILKQNTTFGVFDRHGDIRLIGLGQQGLYHNGTRFLSRLSVLFGDVRPLFLSSAVREDNAWITVDLTNPDLAHRGVINIPRGTLHLARLIVLWDGTLYQRLTLRNYGLTPVDVPVSLTFDADYVDLFEVRGTPRARRGRLLPAGVQPSEVLLAYRGLDDVVRQTRVEFDPAPADLGAGRATYRCRLAPQSEIEYVIAFRCEQTSPRRSVSAGAALEAVTANLRQRTAGAGEVVTSDQQFNDWLERSTADLAMMIADTPSGPYPDAGVPWFSTPFGRDGIITALEWLWINPSLARGVLLFLAATQAHDVRPEQDAQPGKILHEMRLGEMAALGEIPFGRYYGSHDATPLFVMLAAAYYDATADRETIERVWPAILAALAWIDRDGDVDGDGFVEYARQSPTGLVHQGWKDSHDAVHHADGRLAVGPIALCEIQGYVYAAWRGAARLATMLGEPGKPAEWAVKADGLRDRFRTHFWDEHLGSYVLALDGEKRPCAVLSSNAGQVLFTGIADPRHAASVVARLMAPDSFSGWGVRTLSSTAARYNPMSYHNGSIWPHDNALIAAGFRRYGFRDEALRVLSGMFDASLFMDLHRLPELFCGFARRHGESPTRYPVACNPQAWASASVFLLLQAALGLELQAPERAVRLTRAILPPFLEEVRITNLRVGGFSIDLLLERHRDDVAVRVLRREGQVEIISIK